MPPTTVPTDKQLSANGAWTWKVDDVFRDPNRPRLRDTDGLWEAVRRLSCPTLLINGAESDILEPDAAQRMVAAMPHGQLATVSGASHSVMGDNPDGFYQAVKTFLDGFGTGTHDESHAQRSKDQADQIAHTGR